MCKRVIVGSAKARITTLCGSYENVSRAGIGRGLFQLEMNSKLNHL